jgi:hypothetical protein
MAQRVVIGRAQGRGPNGRHASATRLGQETGDIGRDLPGGKADGERAAEQQRSQDAGAAERTGSADANH